MKSVKPGRGPSAMSAAGSVISVAFGILWTILTLSMGAPVIFALFGVLFVILGIIQTVYHFKNATSKNRYSTFDITDEKEEPDPLQQRFHKGDDTTGTASESTRETFSFCPYCGARLDSDFEFCPKCGKQLPN